MTDPVPVAAARRGHVDERGFYRASMFETVTGWIGGFDPVSIPEEAADRGPRERFEEAVLRALQRPPCVVAFSGGRDSSAILAVALHVARREGLPAPIAVTHDFAGRGEADESTWQELVIKHLGVPEWHRIDEVDAFDVLGERARKGLLRFGPMFPALGHCHAPLAEMADGGSLIIGEGGDEVLGFQRMAPIQAVCRSPRLLLSRTPWFVDREVLGFLAESVGPASIRRRIRRQMMSSEVPHPWLRPEWRDAFLDQDAHDHADAPLRWNSAVLRHLGRRTAVVGMANIRTVMAEDGVELHVPFLDPHFVGSWASIGGALGFVSRTAMMRRLFGDLLPDEICGRNSKARFGSVAVGRPSQEFLDTWDGQGVDADIVDLDAFRRSCSADTPMFGTQMLLQVAWLAMQDAHDSTPGVVL